MARAEHTITACIGLSDLGHAGEDVAQDARLFMLDLWDVFVETTATDVERLAAHEAERAIRFHEERQARRVECEQAYAESVFA